MEPNPQTPRCPPDGAAAHAMLLALRLAGVDTVFLGADSPVARMVEAIAPAHGGLCIVRMATEPSAAHAADGHARVTGRAAAVVIGSGEAMARAVPGLMAAQADSVPLVCVCVEDLGHAALADLHGEPDVSSLALPVSKWSGRIDHAGEVSALTRRAVGIAMNGRRGVVVLGVPLQVLSGGEVPGLDRERRLSRRQEFVGAGHAQAPRRQLERIVNLIGESSRPLVLCGGGVVRSGAQACEALDAFLRANRIPCALALTALDALPSQHPHRLGLLGQSGSAAANAAMRQADLVIAFGTRFDASSYPPSLAEVRQRRVIHVDVDPVNIHRVVRADVPVVGDCGEVLSRLNELMSETPPDADRLDAWWTQLAEWKSVSEPVPEKAAGPVTPALLVHLLRERVALQDTVLAMDMSSDTQWLVAHMAFSRPGRWLVSAASAMPGYALPAAAGACVAAPRSRVLCITDPSSLLAAACELPTVAARGWPVKLVCVADARNTVDVVALAQACGWTARRVGDGAQLDDALRTFMVSERPELLFVSLGASGHEGRLRGARRSSMQPFLAQLASP